jgi:hypothetical protein
MKAALRLARVDKFMILAALAGKKWLSLAAGWPTLAAGFV